MDVLDFIQKIIDMSVERFGCIKALPMYISTGGGKAYLLDDIEIATGGCVLILKSDVSEHDRDNEFKNSNKVELCVDR